MSTRNTTNASAEASTTDAPAAAAAMVRVRFTKLCTLSAFGFTARPGAEMRVKPDFAKQLTDGGYAVAIGF